MIRYVCISDLHAGAPASLLTRRGAEHDVAALLAEALGALVGRDGPPPRLILLGDTMDLQFSPRSHAARETGRVLAALHGTGAFDATVLATAGNHDHALWTDARLSLDAAAAARADGADGAGDRPATPAFRPDPAARSRLLDDALARAGFGPADLRYPNIGLGDARRAVILHHGHFHEGAYRAVTALRGLLSSRHRPAPTAASLAAENGGWIDFAWATLGDAHGFGAEAEGLYQRMLTSAGFRDALREWSARIAEAAVGHVPMAADPRVRAGIETAARVILGTTLGRMREEERHHEIDALSRSAREGLAWYLAGPALGQAGEPSELGAAPERLTYLCGHTHKPFLDRIALPGRARPVAIANTGGWTLNGPRLDNAEGAAIALIDEEMNVALLRAVATPRHGRMEPARLESFAGGRPGAQRFRAHLEARLEASRPAWDALGEAARLGYLAIQAELLDRTEGAP